MKEILQNQISVPLSPRSIFFSFDMDGVLAKWNTKASIEDTFETGYFAEREAEPVMIHVVKRMIREKLSVNILSSAYDNGKAIPEKNEWLDKHIGTAGYKRTFVPYGEDKHQYMPHGSVNILIDDYSKNLHSWIANAVEGETNVGFKFYNGINGNHGTWNSYSVNNKMTAEEIYNVITAVAEKIAKN